jgi:adenylate kinase family enzyme
VPFVGRREARGYGCPVKRVLLTGMSGTGKSSIVRVLAARGYKAVDTDDSWCEPLPDGRQQWREDAVERLLDTEDADILFVAGCEENQVRFHRRFDHILLLSTPLETLLERLATRTANPYGRRRRSGAGSSRTSRPWNHCSGKWRRRRSGQRPRSTRWSPRSWRSSRVTDARSLRRTPSVRGTADA